MNMKFYCFENGAITNLGEEFDSIRQAQECCISFLSQTNEAYVDDIGFIHEVTEAGDSLVGIYFLHYRKVIRKLAKWVRDNFNPNWNGLDDYGDAMRWGEINHALERISKTAIRARICTCTTEMAYYDLDHDSIALVNAWTNDPIKQAVLVAKYNNCNVNRDPHVVHTVDDFGFMHTVTTYRYETHDVINGRFFDHCDFDDIIGDLGELLDDSWHGKPVAINDATRNAAQAMYDALVNECDLSEEIAYECCEE